MNRNFRIGFADGATWWPSGLPYAYRLPVRQQTKSFRVVDHRSVKNARVLVKFAFRSDVYICVYSPVSDKELEPVW